MSTDLVITRTTALAPQQAWDAWTDPEVLRTWWWPHLPDTTYDVEPQVGSRYRIESAEAGIGVRGTYTELDPPERLFFTWEWLGEGQGPIELVTVVIEGRDGGSEVTVTHAVDDLAGDPEPLREGWESVLDRLAALPADQSS